MATSRSSRSRRRSRVCAVRTRASTPRSFNSRTKPLRNVQVGGEVVGLGQDDVPARAELPGMGDDLEEVDGGVVAHDHVPGTAPIMWLMSAPSCRGRSTHPLARPRPPALVAPALRHQPPDPLRRAHRHGPPSSWHRSECGRRGAGEPVREGGEGVAAVEVAAGFERVQGSGRPGRPFRPRAAEGVGAH